MWWRVSTDEAIAGKDDGKPKAGATNPDHPDSAERDKVLDGYIASPMIREKSPAKSGRRIGFTIDRASTTKLSEADKDRSLVVFVERDKPQSQPAKSPSLPEKAKPSH
jgi:hypothetical protein